MAIVRQAGVSCNSEFEEILLGNTWTKCFFGQPSEAAARFAAELVGKHLVADDKGALSDEVYRVPPERFSNLEPGECFAVSGARTFHLSVPTPAPLTAPEYRKQPHLTALPDGVTALGLESRYEEFLTRG
jgi:hypothetical protein